MQKTNKAIITLFIIIIAVVLTITACKGNKTNPIIEEVETPQATQPITDAPETEPSTELTTEPTTEPTTQPTTEKVTSANNNSSSSSIKNALFIGDSRTVGLAEYGKISGADFFANVGMSVYNITDAKVSVPSVGKTTLSNLLNNKKYDKIYIMLGINEMGYEQSKTINKYQALIDFVREKEPNATIILQANLHVTHERSQKDKNINNPKIDSLNKQISKLANGKDIFYIDANKLFDDSTNSLSKDKTGDNAHLYAKYYSQWGEWICSQKLN